MFFLPAALIGIIWILFLLTAIALLVFVILTLVSAMNCLEQCRRRFREMEPGMVWLTLIPLFGMVWIYFVIVRVEQALKKEFRSRDLDAPKDFGQPLGIAAAVCWQAGAVLICIGIGVFGMIAGLVLFIMYWQKLSKHLNQLRRTGRGRDDDDDRDEYDDRDRRRSRSDEREEEEEDDRPRRRRLRDDRDERDRDEDEDDRPRRRPRRDDDEDGGWKR